MSSVVPEFMQREQRASTRWQLASSGLGLTLWGLIVIHLPLVLWAAGEPFDARTFSTIAGYPEVLWTSAFVGPLREMLASSTSHVSLFTALVSIFSSAGVALFVTALGWRLNPYRDVAAIHGDARFATKRDLVLMDRSGKCGPSGTLLHLGYAFGQRLGLIETVSMQLLAPPGTGKTTRFVIPAILDTPGSCFVIHDPKPELWQATSGYRASIGQAFQLNWGAVDDPARGLHFPKFNFISKRIVPPAGPARDTFLDSVASILVPDAKESKGDSYFVDQGRSALVGLMHYLIALINDDPDPDRYEGLPPRWHGEEASLPMLVEWLAFSQQESQDEAGKKPAGGGGEDGASDPMRAYFGALVQRARERDYPRNALINLQPLVGMADRERSGVLGTMNQSLIPFRNSAVAERTSASDFVPSDLSGRLSAAALVELGCDDYPATRADWDAIAGRLRPDHWEPVTVYVCVSQSVASAFEKLTALFVDILVRELISYPPGATTEQGVRLGPFPTCFLLDELVKMARCDSVVDGPDLGRGMKRYFILVAQAIDQIERRYSKEQRNTIMSTCAVRAILPQNDKATIEEVANTVGKTTVKRRSDSRQVGWKGQSWTVNRSFNTEGVNLLGQANLGSMPDNSHILVIQDFLNRPVQCRSCAYYLEPEMLAKAWNPRTQSGFAPALELPRSLWTVRDARYQARRAREEVVERTRAREAAFDAWRYDWQALSLDDTPGLAP